MSFVRLPTVGISALLGAFCAALLLSLAWLTAGASEKPFPAGTAKASLSPPGLPEIARLDSQTGAAAEKPLFHVDRKPFLGGKPDPEGTGAPANTDATAFLLKGVLVSDTLERASIAHTPTGESRWVNRGEIFQGWTLVSVEPAEILLVRDGEEDALSLYPGRDASAPGE